MISFQTPFPQLNQRNTVSEAEIIPKKRKYDDTEPHEIATLPYKHCKNSFSDIELHLETPLPSEWQRCLDMKSGEIHFYNTRTHKRTLRDPSATPTDSGRVMSLDLELNLPCGSPPPSEKTNPTMNNKSSNSLTSITHLFMDTKRNSSSEIMEVDQTMEMVATVCMRCHMLVILCKSSPTCPNCKFMHPPYHQSSTDLFLLKPRLSLSC